jgi:hypothetical protein
MRTKGVILLITLASVWACKSRSTASRVKRDTLSMRGFILPGKGFNLVTNDVSSSLCVTGEKIATEDPSVTSSDTTTTPPTTDPAAEGSITGGDTTPVNTGVIEPVTPDMLLSENDALDIGDIQLDIAYEKRTGAALGDTSGTTAISLYYLTSTKDVTSAIDATYANNASASMSKKRLSGEIASSFEAQLNARFQNTSENVFILMHGRKEFPAKASNAIVNPQFNSKHRQVVFSGKALPGTEATMADSWGRLVKICGDHYIEYTVQGREIWMVAVMNKKTFEASMGGSVNYGAKAAAKFSSAGEVSKEMKAGVKANGSTKLMDQTVDVMVRTRGRNTTEGAKLTLEESLTEMNKLLTAEEQSNEAVLSVGIKSYDNVIFSFEPEGEKRGGDIFSRKVREAARLNTDVLAKLLVEENWASKEADRIWSTYGWEQWSLDPRFHNGIAAQYKSVKAYLRKISDAFEYCGGRSIDFNAVTNECIAMSNSVIDGGRPQLNLPTPLAHTISFWMPPATIAAADMKNWGNGAGEVTFDEARRSCASETGSSWTIPGQEDWKRVLDASYFYTKWMRDQNPGYRADEDKILISYPCGRFKGATFWSDRAGSVVQMNHTCDSSQVQDQDVPSSQKYTSWIFWTKEKSRYACVNYKAK